MWQFNKGVIFWVYGPFLLIIGILIYMGLTTDPEAMTDDGTMNLRLFFFLMAGLFFLTSMGSLLFFWGSNYLYNNKFKYLSENGRRGVAKLIDYRTTGLTVNDAPQIEMELEIKIAGRMPYNIKHKELINLVDLPKLKKNEEIPVLADPEKDNNILLIWD